jgi:hypothetical protein
MCNSFSKDCIQGASAAPFANALYSISVDDQEILGCLRALQEMRLGLKKIANPPVDRRSSTLPAQSTLVKILSNAEDDLVNQSPVAIMPLTNLNICLTASQ